MNRAEIKHQTRILVTVAGGVEEAARIAGCSKSSIGKYQDEHQKVTMTVEVMARLEAHIGFPILSQFIFERVVSGPVNIVPMTPPERLRVLDKETWEFRDAFMADNGRLGCPSVIRKEGRDALVAIYLSLADVERTIRGSPNVVRIPIEGTINSSDT